MLAVASGDVDRAREVLQLFHDRGLTEAERQAADLVVDFDAEETTCPACLTAFAPARADGSHLDRCPDCGLFLGA